MTHDACARCGRPMDPGEERHVPKLVAEGTAFAFALFHGGMWAKETLGKPFCAACVRTVVGLAVLVSAGALAAAALGLALWIRGSVAPLAVRGGPAESAAESGSGGWSVLKNGKVVAWIDDKPGLLISVAAPPPPGTPLRIHPFLTGNSKDAASENDLREILERSTSFRDYADRLKKSGYEVRPAADGD